MSDRDEALSKEDWQRQVEGHLASLKAAGVEWLPRGRPWTPPAESQAADSPPALAASVGLVSQPVSNAGKIPGAQQTGWATRPTQEPPQPAPSSALSLEQRRQALRVLADEVKGCTRCAELVATRTQTVFAAGEPGAELCFIGEAPGADEDAQGFPFVGAAGQLLNKIIEACGMKREEVYICNILKCRPPGNRTPLPNEAMNCRPFLDRQLELVQPKFICTLGGCAAQNLLNTTTPIGKLRGRFHDYRGIPVLVTYHPAYLLPHRSPEKKRDVWEDMKMLLARMGRPIPQK